MTKLKLAPLGYGDVAQRDYLPELHRLADRVDLVAVCSRTGARARAVAEAYGVAAWYTDYRQLLAESEADIVANLTPIQMHAETTLAALRAGKHVYTEKPVASTVEIARRIQDKVNARGLMLVCASCVLLFPQVLYAQSLIRAGAIGPISSARGVGQGGVPPWQGYTSDPSPYFAPGAGPALDMGVYPLHALTGLLGPVKRVTAMTARVQQCFVVADGPAHGRTVEIGVEDNWLMTLDFGGERLATVESGNCVQGTRAPHLELFGLRGTIALDLLDVASPVEVLSATGSWEQVVVPYERRSGPDHILGIAHLADCVRSGTRPLLSVEHAVHVVDIVETAARAAREGRALDIKTTFERRQEET